MCCPSCYPPSSISDHPRLLSAVTSDLQKVKATVRRLARAHTTRKRALPLPRTLCKLVRAERLLLYCAPLRLPPSMGDANLHPHNLHPVTQGQPSHHNHHLDRQIQTVQMQSPYMQNPTPPHSAPTLSNGPPTNAAPSNQVPGHPSFRRYVEKFMRQRCMERNPKLGD